jgi:thioredoxin 1
MLMINVIKLNNENYKEIVSTGLTVVDVKTDWCGPCKVLSPIIDELSDEYGNIVKFGKLDADESGEIVKDLSIRNIPTILIYKDGEIVERSVGMISKNELKELVNKHLEDN